VSVLVFVLLLVVVAGVDVFVLLDVSLMGVGVVTPAVVPVVEGLVVVLLAVAVLVEDASLV